MLTTSVRSLRTQTPVKLKRADDGLIFAPDTAMSLLEMKIRIAFVYICLALLVVSPFLPLLAPTPRFRHRLGFMGLQLLIVLAGLLVGWGPVGEALWQASGGCRAHGGSFEGECGYAAFGTSLIASVETAAIVGVITGVGFILLGRRMKRVAETSALDEK